MYLLFTLSGVIHVCAQEPSLRNFDLTKGLPSNECYHVVQDHKGYLWIASDGGLSRYNGYSFRNFTKADGLPDNVILQLFVDKKGRVWVAGLNSKIAYFEEEAFHPIKELNNFLESNAKRAEISSMFLNEQDELVIGFNVFYAYIITYSLQQHKVVGQKKVEPRSIYMSIAQSSGLAFGTTNTGGYDLNVPYNLKVILDSRKGAEDSLVISYVTRPNLSCYTRLNGDSLLISIDKDLYLIHANSIKKIFTTSTNILFLYRDSHQRIWVLPHNNGAFVFGSDAELGNMPTHLFSGYSFSSVMEDQESDYWLSSLKDGLYQIPDFSITHYLIKENDRPVRMNAVVKNGDILYVAGLSRNVYSLSEKEGMKPSVQLPDSNVEVYDMRSLKRGLVLVGSHSYVGDMSGKVRYVKQIKQIKAPARGNPYVNYLDAGASDKNTVLILGTHKGSIVTDIATGIICREFSVYATAIFSVFSDTTSNRIYQACLDGLYYTTDSFRTYTKVPDTLMRTRINHLFKKDNVLLLSSKEKGLIFWDGKKSWNITRRDGLASDECRKSLVDKQGNIWVATNRGMSRISISSGGKYTIDNLTSHEGLTGDDIYNFSIIGNELWIPTASGITHFNTKTLRNNRMPPPIYITSVTIDDSVPPDKLTSNITYNHSYIKINYNGISYKGNGDLIYQYRLRGLDSNWKETRNTQVQFSRLTAGEYQFEIKAIKNGTLASAMAVYRFVVFPPWYKTWWFLIGSGVSTVFLIYAFFWLRFRRLAHREEEKTKLVTMITETEIKALRAQTNPHFIFNSLNSISLFILKNDPDQAQFYLMRFAQLMRDVLENSEHESISLSKEFAILKTYMDLELLRFGGKYRFEIEVPDESWASLVMIPPLLLQPIIENAIWHGLMPLEDREGSLLLKAERKDKAVIVTVEDNGIGRRRSAEIKAGKSTHKTSKGIFITQNRIKLFNNKHVEKIRIITTDLVGPDSTPAGTRVELIIENL